MSDWQKIETTMRMIGFVVRFALIVGGLVLWMLGLMALDVPAGLEHWRHIAGVALMVAAVYAWKEALEPQERIPCE